MYFLKTLVHFFHWGCPISWDCELDSRILKVLIPDRHVAMTQPLDGVRVVGLCMPKVFAQVCLPVVMPDNLVAFRQIRACLKAMRRESLNTT